MDSTEKLKKSLIEFVSEFIAMFIYSLVLMLLWNELMPFLFKLPQVGYVQAIGMWILGGLLFKQKKVITREE